MLYFARYSVIELIAIMMLFGWTEYNRILNYHSFGVDCNLLKIEDFYSQSFVPNGLHIAYRIGNGGGIDYNLTLLQSFPGKILINIFIRKVATNSGEKSVNVVKEKNLDFCKIIEMVQNFSMTTQNATFLQSTFITSCPLIRGFYYITNGTLKTRTIPSLFVRGIYWLQIELVQIFGEVTRLMNVKAKCNYEPPSVGALDIFHVLELHTEND
ncbi:uncharacterized protein [Eurosta solidaginis]|uniref:uncharacterized protein n=1 Tax=Eurosta solidaginis TaxID=178769 RepID=UPI0035309F06